MLRRKFTLVYFLARNRASPKVTFKHCLEAKDPDEALGIFVNLPGAEGSFVAAIVRGDVRRIYGTVRGDVHPQNAHAWITERGDLKKERPATKMRAAQAG